MAFQSDLCQDYWAPFATSVTTSVVAAILTIITVPGNLLICWAVIWNPTRNLKTSFNYLVLNLAIADLIIGTVTDPLFVGFHVNEALENEVLSIQWLVHVSYFMTSTASVLSIVALAVNRYQLVTSMNRIQQSNVSRTIATSVTLWIFSLGLPVLYLAVGFYKLAFIFANTAVIITSVVLVFVYYRICHNLKRHKTNSVHIQSIREREKHARREEKATNSLILITILFVVCAFSSCVMIYVINLCHTCSCVLILWFRDLQFLFLLVNSATNQFLYAWRMRSFRRAFQTIPAVQWFAKKFGRAISDPMPSNTPSLELIEMKCFVSARSMKRETDDVKL